MALSSFMPSPRRFPPPWSIDEHEECFIVRDASGQALAYVYFVEQAAIIDQIGGAPHLLRDLGQPPLDAVDGGREPMRFGQSEQCQRAICFELDDALDQRPSTLRA